MLRVVDIECEDKECTDHKKKKKEKRGVLRPQLWKTNITDPGEEDELQRKLREMFVVIGGIPVEYGVTGANGVLKRWWSTVEDPREGKCGKHWKPSIGLLA